MAIPGQRGGQVESVTMYAMTFDFERRSADMLENAKHYIARVRPLCGGTEDRGQRINL